MQRLPRSVGLAVVTLLLCLPVAKASANGQRQDQGVAVIISPLEGASLAGVVPIAGSASHPDFRRYELAFAYFPNPTDTWFAVQPASATPIVGDVLGRWDTSQISDGIYVLRLRVFYGDGAFFDALVANLHVSNATPTAPFLATPNPGGGADAGATETAIAATSATATRPVIVLPATSTPRPSPVPVNSTGGQSPSAGTPRISSRLVGLAFLAGVRLSLIAFLLLAAYASVKAALRAVRR